MTFDNLWEQKERQALLGRLHREYPAWQRKRKVRRTVLASVAVLAVVGFSIFNFQLSTPKGYDSVACNRSTFPDDHWANVASHVLVRNNEM